ncbi:Spore protein SP21 [Hartmannibacter diazotrophicus]|uniref:Spore protein SP21 n=1 Tax=Hartmannibacter diazotrophicus TaxID=1482074 RepID=A0A2C9D9C9_9HYPH|nr:Hsp20/alpha crystallin family protein [Hartmannibacter diazotrophicus]SON56341.1 Spore protein SP21 [Hartmannibacter diazotrophicus]
MVDTVAKVPVQKEAAANTPPATTEEHTWPFQSLRREIDRLFDDFMPTSRMLPLSRPGFGFEVMWPRSQDFLVAPAMDLVEKDGGYEISAELPGIDEKNIEVKIAGGLLTIKGEKTEEKEKKDKEYHMSERRYGSFQRSFKLPEGVDADAIKADISKGVLTVKMPKSAEAKKSEKTIPVKAA